MPDRIIKKIILHCSASDRPFDDDIDVLKDFHTGDPGQKFTWGIYETRGRGFNDVGYHFFIDKKGEVHKGRSLNRAGAHCRGENQDSIGICISGNRNFKNEQFVAAAALIKGLCAAYRLKIEHVKPHNFYNTSKTCPNFEINKVI